MKPAKTKGHTLIELLIVMAIISVGASFFHFIPIANESYQAVKTLQDLIEMGRLTALTSQTPIFIHPLPNQLGWSSGIGLYKDTNSPPFHSIEFNKKITLTYQGFPKNDELKIYSDGLMRGNGTFTCQLGNKGYYLIINHAGYSRIVKMKS